MRVPKISTGADTSANCVGSSMDSSSATSSSDDASPTAAAAAAASPGEVTAADLAQLHALDIRVGKIISCEQHPDADRYGREGTTVFVLACVSLCPMSLLLAPHMGDLGSPHGRCFCSCNVQTVYAGPAPWEQAEDERGGAYCGFKYHTQLVGMLSLTDLF